MTRGLAAGYAVLAALLTAGAAPAGTAAFTLIAAAAGYALLRLTTAGLATRARQTVQDWALARECAARDAQAAGR